MDNVKGILAILVLLLGGTCFILFLQYGTTKTQLSDALLMSDSSLALLRTQGVPCSASAAEFAKISRCIAPALLQKDFKEGGFGQPDTTKGTPGFIIITNVNQRMYESSRFSFQFNRATIQEGCHIPGNITTGVACRFNFDTHCDKGDVLEVFYATNISGTPTQAKVFTKNC